MPSSHRLAILSAQEIDELYGIPRFTSDDRQMYFDFSAPEQQAIEARTFSVGLYLALELGYFKAKRQFFSFDQHEVLVDFHHLAARYFSGRSCDDGTLKMPSRPTRAANQKAILELLNYRLCDTEAKEGLERKAQRIVNRPVF